MAEQIISKRCSNRKCRKIKPLSEFPKCRSGKYGYHNQCKNCKNRAKRIYRQTERGKAALRKAVEKYQKTEKCKATQKRYRQSEAGIVTRRKASKKFYKTEKGKQAHKKYCIENREKRQAKNAVNDAIRKKIIPKPNMLKCNCGKQAEQYHHHKGYAPEHWLDVVPVCIPCHNNTYHQPRTILGW